jgi:hypothetical protein
VLIGSAYNIEKKLGPCLGKGHISEFIKDDKMYNL